MGPQLLIDKSTIQSLSADESLKLLDHYLLVYAPVLFLEILGDIKKVSNDPEQALKVVRHTASKICGMNSYFTADYRTLLKLNLLGIEVTMDYRPVLLGGKNVVDSTGRKGTFFEEDPEQIALRRWVAGDFTEAEQALSEKWRLSTRAIDLEAWKRRELFPCVDSLKDIPAVADEICNNPSFQLENLQFLLLEVGIEPEVETKIFVRWMSKGMPPLREFAPFAYYCSRVFVSFYAAISNNLVGTKSTNRIDLEYLMYLPFCRVFTSSDNFHKKFAPLFLTEEQAFADGHQLKRDIGRIRDWWLHLSDRERADYRRKFGDYPPELKDSITLEMWKRYCRPREECGQPDLTPELQESLMRHLRPTIDAIKEVRDPH